MKSLTKIFALHIVALIVIFASSCQQGGNNSNGLLSKSMAERSYVAPGDHDEFYGFLSGGFNGQVSVIGLPSGRIFKNIAVFSVDGEKAYGFSEETKALLNTSYGFIPWGDSHHPDISQTNGELDGRWLFVNENNTPRIARIDLTTFETVEIIEIPNSAGNHCSPYVTDNTEYLCAATRFAVPVPQKDMPISDYAGNFKGMLSFLSVDQENGNMNLDFQILAPGFDYDKAHPGRGKSHGWMFFTTYNVEEANTLLEVNASQRDKDFIAAVNWQKAEEYIEAGNYTTMSVNYAHNKYDESTHMASTTMKSEVKVLDPANCPGLMYFLPTPKSPHGCDVDPTGEYIVGNGKLSADLTVHSFTNMMKAIEEENYEGEAYGIPILSYEAVIGGKVVQPGLGPLHTEFDGEGNAYTSFFISSEVVKWKLGTWEVLDRKPTYYSVGHVMIPGGNSQAPFGKYLLAMNKITKDRYLPTGPEVCHAAQLYDISGEKMELLIDFPTLGEPHYAAGIPAELIKSNSKKIYKLADNNHPYVVKTEADTRVERDGNEVHVYMTVIRSHFAPDNIEGIKAGDKVYFHVTNLEQDYDVPHGVSMIGANTSEILVMPGQTRTLVWEPKLEGVWPFYCTDFCSALHQEMQGYVRVSSANSNIDLAWSLDGE